jgi:copper resistance protein C
MGTLTVPTIVSAHTEIKSSFPQDGQMIDSDLEEINLQFGGEIEELSTMELLNGGVVIPIDQVIVQETQMMGTLSQPLANGSYTVKWRIAGEDGHVIEGIILFTVQKEQIGEESLSTPAIEDQQAQQEQIEDKLTDQENANMQNNSNQNKPNMIGTVSIVIFILILIVGIPILFRKKS